MSKAVKFYSIATGNQVIPKVGSKYSAGYDLMASARTVVPSGKYVKVPTGLRADIPEGYYGQLALRSGAAYNNGLVLSAGVIDSDYKGEISLIITALDNEVVIKEGDKVAQLIPIKYLKHDDESLRERGAAGFGSSDHLDHE